MTTITVALHDTIIIILYSRSSKNQEYEIHYI